MAIDTSLPIQGTVTDDQGNAREGAEVRLYRLDTEDTNSDGEPDNITGLTFLARQQADANGDFSFSDSLPGTYVAGQSEEIEYVAVVAHGLDSGSGEPLDNGRFPVLDAENEQNSTMYITAYSKKEDRVPDAATFRVSLQEETGFSDGDRINTLTDQIGSKDLTDGAGLDYTASAINGYPAAFSDGVDDGLGLDSWGDSYSLPYTVSGVFQRVEDTGFGIHVCWRGGASGSLAGGVYPSRSDYGSSTFDLFNGTALNGPNADNNPHAYVAVFDGVDSVFNVDGTEFTGDAGTVPIDTNGPMRIGKDSRNSTGYTKAYHGEVVLTPERFDSAQRDDEIARLKDEWGIA
jgi:hypothetical protein